VKEITAFMMPAILQRFGLPDELLGEDSAARAQSNVTRYRNAKACGSTPAGDHQMRDYVLGRPPVSVLVSVVPVCWRLGASD
jgi:hypothetical protein